METARFKEVTRKVKELLKNSSEVKKDELVASMKVWLKANRNTPDKCKYDAIHNLLTDIGVY